MLDIGKVLRAGSGWFGCGSSLVVELIALGAGAGCIKSSSGFTGVYSKASWYMCCKERVSITLDE